MNTKNMTDVELSELSSTNVVKHVVITDDGKQSSENLYDFEKNDFGISPTSCSGLDEKSALLYATSGLFYKIGLIEW
jgi:hypothetical protein